MKQHEHMGKTATDNITGFNGVIVGYIQYISGCNQLLLVPKVDKDGKRREGEWFDEQRCTIILNVPTIELDNGDTPGCDQPGPKR